MKKLKIKDLSSIVQSVKKGNGACRAKITVHMGTCGIASGAEQVMLALTEEFAKNNIEDVILTSSGCAGLCSKEPMATSGGDHDNRTDGER